MAFHHYVVVWTTDQTGHIDDMLDDYATFEEEAEAVAFYEGLLEDETTYSAHLCVPVQSTDLVCA